LAKPPPKALGFAGSTLRQPSPNSLQRALFAASLFPLRQEIRVMFSLIARATSLFERIPGDLIAIVARIGIASTFLRSGLLKVDGWSNGNTLALFTDEYKLPLIPPEIAATMATAAELSMPVFILAGFFTRFAALALLVMTLTIEIFVYPNAFDTHGLWAAALLYLMKYGPGILSLDNFVSALRGNFPGQTKSSSSMA
jgi:putative oxidoreductase